jgi:putative flavoprotein involved in K+ transport
VIVGAGQAGLALSRHLAAARRDHVVLERGSVGERWRSGRWDSLALLTPNWLSNLPGGQPHAAPDGFLGRQAFADYLEDYALDLPVAEGTSVDSVERHGGGFLVRTDSAVWRAPRVVLATGWSDLPLLPSVAQAAPDDVLRLHSGDYRSAAKLPAGGVLVVGAGPSGQQIALELLRAGRRVVVAVGRHSWLPRSYRSRDVWSWLEGIGDLDETIDAVPDRHAARETPSLALSGANGGERLDLGLLSDEGAVLTGRLTGFSGRLALFAGDLGATVAEAAQRMRNTLARIDEHVASGPCARATVDPEPVPDVTVSDAPSSIHLGAAGISTIIWATGYRRRYDWLRVPVLGADGEIVHRRGVTPVPGLYALGLRFQHRRRSHFIGGVGEDADFLALHILEQEGAVSSRRRLRRAQALVRSTLAARQAAARRGNWCMLPGPAAAAAASL